MAKTNLRVLNLSLTLGTSNEVLYPHSHCKRGFSLNSVPAWYSTIFEILKLENSVVSVYIIQFEESENELDIARIALGRRRKLLNAFYLPPNIAQRVGWSISAFKCIRCSLREATNSLGSIVAEIIRLLRVYSSTLCTGYVYEGMRYHRIL